MGAAGRGAAAPRILVVDDEPVILDLLVDVLDRRGYRVDTASSGEEAERKLLAAPYAVLLADIRMPRMSGIELYRKVVAERPELCGRAIFMTGDIVAFEAHRMLEDLDAPTLSKPIDLAELLRTIESALAAEPAGVAG
jgi:CheY-like chemotaxis protein